MDKTYTWQKDDIEIDMDLLLPENIAIFSHRKGNGRYVIGSISFSKDTTEVADYIADLFEQLPALMRMW